MSAAGLVSLLDAFAAGVRAGFEAHGGASGPAPYPHALQAPFQVAWGVGAELGAALWRDASTTLVDVGRPTSLTSSTKGDR